jgi:hypothetical protein
MFEKVYRALVASLLVAVLGLVALVIAAVNYQHRPPYNIALFDSGVPGTAEANEALQFAHDARVDQIINYSILNASPNDIDDYLTRARAQNVQIVVSLKDLLGPADLDPANEHFHAQFGGDTNEARVANIVKLFDGYSAVWGYFISDELPQDVNGLAQWGAPLADRYDQIKQLSSKPVLASVWRNPVGFLKTVKQGTDHLMMDYYPYPEGPGQTYGPVADIKPVAEDVFEAAGSNGWFAIQAFSYAKNEPDTGKRFNFPEGPGSGAPSTNQMVKMARLALDGGVKNLAFFSYGYARDIPGQLDELQDAIARIRTVG